MSVPATLELVVARHTEDLRWLRRVPDSWRITVYDKGGGTEGAEPLPNVGREAHSYLHHLVTRYDDLADLTVFVQGKPFDHVPDLHTLLRKLADGSESVAGFRWLGFLIDWDDPDGSRLYQAWSKNPEKRPLPGREFHRRVWGVDPGDRWIFYGGAHFGVTADVVRSRERSFYANCLDVSTHLDEAAHCFERTWDKVFGVNGIPGSFAVGPFPRYLKPIRRLMDLGETPTPR